MGGEELGELRLQRGPTALSFRLLLQPRLERRPGARDDGGEVVVAFVDGRELALEGLETCRRLNGPLERISGRGVHLLPLGDPTLIAACDRTGDLDLEAGHRLLHRLALERGRLVALAGRDLLLPAHPGRGGGGRRVVGAAADRAGTADGQAARELGCHPRDASLPQVQVVVAEVLGATCGLLEKHAGLGQPGPQECRLLGRGQSGLRLLQSVATGGTLRREVPRLRQRRQDLSARGRQADALVRSLGDLTFQPDHPGRQGPQSGALVLELGLAGQPGLGHRAHLAGPRHGGSEVGRPHLGRRDLEQGLHSTQQEQRRRLGLRRCLGSGLGPQGCRQYRSSPAVPLDRRDQGRLHLGRAGELGQRGAGTFAPGACLGPSPSHVVGGSVDLEPSRGSGEALLERCRGARGALQELTGPGDQTAVVHQWIEVVKVPLVGGLHPGCLPEAVDHPGRAVVVGLAPAPKRRPAIDEPPLHLLEPAGAEETLQDGVAFGRGCAQERLEPSLRQHGHLGELGAGHAEQPTDELPGLVEAVRQGGPPAGELLLDHDVCLHPGGAGPAALGTVPGGRTGEPEGAVADAEKQHHQWLGLRVCVVAAQVAGAVPVTRHLAVEGEAHAVQDAGLAGAGVTGQQEHASTGELVEVDLHGVDERAERGHRERVQPHQPLTTASRAATRSASSVQHSRAVRSRVDSAASAGVPRTWLTKSRATS